MPRRFAFGGDPLFLTALALFALNEGLLKPFSHSPFLHGHFNDLLLIPCALPILLWIHQQLGWRGDHPPTAAEIGGHLLIWCPLFEAIGPRLMSHATGDWWDVVSYVAGGILSWFIWNRRPSPALATTP